MAFYPGCAKHLFSELCQESTLIQMYPADMDNVALFIDYGEGFILLM